MEVTIKGEAQEIAALVVAIQERREFDLQLDAKKLGSILSPKASLHNFATCDLVSELEHREGVTTKRVEPYQDFEVKVNGPAVVLAVID